jgi:hypothetical protein
MARLDRAISIRDGASRPRAVAVIGLQKSKDLPIFWKWLRARTMESNVVDAIERASQLPLRDAAFHLWMRRHQLNRAERPAAPKSDAKSEPFDPEVFHRMIRAAMASVSFERENAHHGETFWRLKQAHPNANDEELRLAIKQAVKLDTDATKNFSCDVASHGENVHRAVQLTRQENPGFSESTYQDLEHRLAIDMR